MGTQRHTKPPRVILVAEDDDEDFYLLRRALAKSRLRLMICQVRDGKQVMHYLDGLSVYRDRVRFPQPDLLILDLKMPIMDGFDVLAALRKSPRFCELPVVVMSGSNIRDDEATAMALGASGFYVKSTNPQQARKTLAQIARKWLRKKRAAP